MGQLGTSVMLGILSGDGEAEPFTNSVGKIITDLKLEDDKLMFTLIDGSKMNLYDGGQNCCEWRHMHTDDDLSYYIGSTLMGAEISEGPTEEWDEDDDCKESEFLKVKTSKGVFTMVNYNVHNGYYGGFWIISENG